MTCDPFQANFLAPLSIKEGSVEGVKYLLSHQFADGFYNSCRDVSMGNDRVIDMICEQPDCTLDLLLRALGNGSRAPFYIDFVVSDVPEPRPSVRATIAVDSIGESLRKQEGVMTITTSAAIQLSTEFIVPMNATAWPCNKGVPARGKDVETEACSCLDCNSSCTPVPPPKPKPTPPSFLGIPISYIIGFLIFALFLLVFAAYHIFIYLNPPTLNLPIAPPSNEDQPRAFCLDAASIKAETWLNSRFIY
ncbi:unnamed protein product [Protopolystoma xenopodis]|uniref:Niemann-Pick C1 N-terminal domain-containing protein n=1 Tax=Protopolystoma xenopodis TaxID=117903 RepID=A0A3S5FGC4_9PLAT|nr:unnamed protein product [Protopolystoma xenopodis]